jgi:hypothetical protein
VVSYYRVIQYVPDPVTDERINVGVVTYGDGSIRTKFLKDLRRARQFGGGSDLGFVRDFAHALGNFAPSGHQLELPQAHAEVEMLLNAATRWVNSIQLTEPKTSVLKPDELLLETSGRFLKEPPTSRRRFRDRSHAVRLAAGQIRAALDQKLGDQAQSLFKRNIPVTGHFDQHRFDVGVGNGKVYFTAQAMSFEGPETIERDKEIRATAWTIEDVKELHKDLAVGIVALPPKTHSKEFDRAVSLFQALGAEVVDEKGVVGWADSKVNDVAVEIG